MHKNRKKCAYFKHFIPKLSLINNFVGHKNWIDTCDVRIRLHLECTNTTVPSIVLEFICKVTTRVGNQQPILIFCLLDVFKFGILVKYVSPVVKISNLFLIFYLQNDQPAIFKANFLYALIWNYKFWAIKKPK